MARKASGNLASSSSPQTITMYTASADIDVIPYVFDKTGVITGNANVAFYVHDGTADRLVSPASIVIELNQGVIGDVVPMASGDVLKCKVTFGGTVSLDWVVRG